MSGSNIDSEGRHQLTKPLIAPATTARISNPSTSSTTAARPDDACFTRTELAEIFENPAVMPTLVAQRLRR